MTGVDTLGCAFQEFSVESPRLSETTATELTQIGELLAERVSYLLEPISVSEIDDESCTLQMRSVKPDRNEIGRSYYEILARRGGTISLRRYLKTPDQPRSVIPSTVTREVLIRLSRDFISVLP